MKRSRRSPEAAAKVWKYIFYYTIDLERSAIFSVSLIGEFSRSSVHWLLHACRCRVVSDARASPNSGTTAERHHDYDSQDHCCDDQSFHLPHPDLLSSVSKARIKHYKSLSGNLTTFLTHQIPLYQGHYFQELHNNK